MFCNQMFENYTEDFVYFNTKDNYTKCYWNLLIKSDREILTANLFIYIEQCTHRYGYKPLISWISKQMSNIETLLLNRVTQNREYHCLII